MPVSSDPVFDPARIAAVNEILPGRLGDPEFDRLTELASKLLNIPTCLISLVTGESQDFKGACGLPSAIAATRSTPLSHSLCKHTVTTAQILKIEDARIDSRVSKNPVVDAIGLRAYLGFPLINSSGQILGAFCLIDYAPRKWTHSEIDSIRNFAALAVNLIEYAVKESRTSAALDVIAHDLRSPLSGISLAASILQEQAEAIPAKLHRVIDTIASSTQDAVSLLNTFSEIENQLNDSVCNDPGGVIETVVARLQLHMDKKGMSIITSKDDPQILAVSTTVLEQILENLLSNALKYAPPNTSVWISFVSGETEGHFKIRDEGPGFSESDRLRMFQRYSRLSATPTGDENSTGIGLSIAKRLSEQSGGSLELVSPPASGAEFRLSFPCH
ncbi:MAG: GAF domain-containing sensor histidine kinase [Luteolibacter sp.]